MKPLKGREKTLVGHYVIKTYENFAEWIFYITFACAKRKVIFEVADMAQLVEQRIRNAWVAGSSPAIGSLWCEESE